MPESRQKCCSREDVPFMQEDQDREYFSKRGICKSVGLDGLHQSVLRVLADVTVKLLSIISDQS